MKIQQFSLIECDGQELRLPKDARVLTVDSINHHPFIWILVDETQQEQESRTFKMVNTHELIRKKIKSYICSFKNTTQTEMIHIFEV